jgi:hypothetical protein
MVKKENYNKIENKMTLLCCLKKHLAVTDELGSERVHSGDVASFPVVQRASMTSSASFSMPKISSSPYALSVFYVQVFVVSNYLPALFSQHSAGTYRVFLWSNFQACLLVRKVMLTRIIRSHIYMTPQLCRISRQALLYDGPFYVSFTIEL